MRVAKKRGRVGWLMTAILCGLAVVSVLCPDGFVARGLSKSAVRSIRFYQANVSPLLQSHVRCRLRPTCSEFARQEFIAEPFWDASAAVAERLLLCARAAPVVGSTVPVLALLMQRGAQDQAAAATCCAGFGFLVFVVIAVFVVSILLLVWVARDAKNRGVDNPVLWLMLVFFTGIIGLIIYLAVRPTGNLILCEHCPNKKLPYALTCPHCGKADARAQAAD